MTNFSRFICLSLALLSNSVIAQTYSCNPTTRYECTADKCEKVSEESVHGDYTIDKSTKNLSVCLGDSCYSGKAVIAVPKMGTALTAIGYGLKSLNNPHDSLSVSISVFTNKKFTATWERLDQGVTLDMGACK
jgi:hypothetical protein